MADLLFPDESYAIVGACFEVYNEQGSGFLEAVYEECLNIEFELRSITAIVRPTLELSYKGRTLAKSYEADFVCFGKIIVELKAVSQLVNEHRAQLHNYLKSTGHRLGILVNFGSHPKLQYERVVR